MSGLRNTKIEHTLNLKFFVLDDGSTATFHVRQSDFKPYHVGLQVPLGVDSEISEEGYIR